MNEEAIKILRLKREALVRLNDTDEAWRVRHQSDADERAGCIVARNVQLAELDASIAILERARG